MKELRSNVGIVLVLLLKILLLSQLLGESNAVPTPEEVQVVHVVTMNHLDVGFNGIDPTVGFARNVINKYFEDYYPKSIAVSEALRLINTTESGLQPRMIYTHSFLLSLYFNCTILDGLHCPSQTAMNQLKQAIERGDVAWHAFPFNSEPELFDKQSFDFGIYLSHHLDEVFGKPTATVMSQRDVPGMTRSVIPLLRKRGVIGLTVGVNSASAPPAVPQAFIWNDPNESDRDLGEILTIYNPGGYGDISLASCVWNITGLTHALCFEFEGDNAGPPSVSKVISDWNLIHSLFPNAEIIPSTLDDWFGYLNDVRSNLPTLSNEIGDTWIHGVPSDPLKLAIFRAIQRERSACIEQLECSIDPNVDFRFFNFSRLFLKLGEHTWGLDVKKVLKDYANWTNAEFNAAKSQSNYITQIDGWIEQRLFIDWAIEALNADAENERDHILKQRILNAINDILHPSLSPPLQKRLSASSHIQKLDIENNDHRDRKLHHRVSLENLLIETAYFTVTFNSTTGAINKLQNKTSGREWADDQHQLGVYAYQSLAPLNYYQFESSYFYCHPRDCDWELKDFGKPNLTSANVENNYYYGEVVESYSYEDVNHYIVSVILSLPSISYIKYGAPQEVYLLYNIPKDQPKIELTTILVNKTSTRLPEFTYLSFNPITDSSLPFSANSHWSFLKLGEEIKVNEVIGNGSFHLHGVGSERDAVKYIDNNNEYIYIQTLDAAIVTPGEAIGFPTPLEEPNVNLGVHFHLENNIWGTNYIMWYPFLTNVPPGVNDATIQYRFTLEI